MINDTWIAQIPENWRIVPFGSLFTQRKEKNKSLSRDFVLSVMKGKGVIPYTEKGNIGNKVSEDLSGYKIVNKGDFVLNSMNLYMGSVGVSEYDGVTSAAYIVCQPSPGVISSSYYKYIIHCAGFQEYVGLLGKGIMEIREAVRWTALKSVNIPVPDEQTQKEIADFLDRETTRIDQLIEKKETLNGLLVEREKSLITNCLTRGTDASTPLKDSGIDWIGDIPEHWEVYPLKQLIWYQEGPGILAKDFHEEGVPLIRIKGISGKIVSLIGCNYLDPEKVQQTWKHFRVEEGDLLISASATRGGTASEVTSETTGAIPYTGIIRIKPRKNGYCKPIIPYFMLSGLFDTQIDLLSAGSTIQHFGPSHLGRMKALLPPIDEQQKIAKYLDTAVGEIRSLREKNIDSIGLLKDFRTSLITEAVTGQLDIKKWKKKGGTDKRLDNIEGAMAS